MNIEDLQAICKSLPFVTEDIKWEHDLVFSIGGKMFCVVGLNQVPTTASFKVRDDQFEELCNLEIFKPAPYVAKYKWVLINDITKINTDDWRSYITQSYELVIAKLPKKIKKEIGL
jgi:predicted DNA-binding protein (MmcQ/YjbR family)